MSPKVRVCFGGGDNFIQSPYVSLVCLKVPQMNKKVIEDLLKKGAYAAVMDDDDAGDR